MMCSGVGQFYEPSRRSVRMGNWLAFVDHSTNIRARAPVHALHCNFSFSRIQVSSILRSVREREESQNTKKKSRDSLGTTELLANKSTKDKAHHKTEITLTGVL